MISEYKTGYLSSTSTSRMRMGMRRHFLYKGEVLFDRPVFSGSGDYSGWCTWYPAL